MSPEARFEMVTDVPLMLNVDPLPLEQFRLVNCQPVPSAPCPMVREPPLVPLVRFEKAVLTGVPAVAVVNEKFERPPPLPV